MRLPVLALTLCFSLIVPAASFGQQAATVPVGTVAAERRPVTRALDFVGRIEAMQRVEIRARVTGFLQQVAFKEGEVVHAGQVLYRIEPDSFEAAQMQARGALVQAQAKFANATAQRARTEELVRTKTAPQAQLDDRIAAEKQAQGEIITADADLKTATINLGYTTITSPITGEVGRTKLTVGNLVGPNSGPLTQVVSQDPMYVVFPVSQREFLRLKDEAQRRAAQQGLTVRILFSDGSTYDQVGHINFIDVTVDRATDTITVRATIANPKGTLIDGQLVRVAVQSGQQEEKVLVPQTALLADQQGVYVFIVEGGKAEVRRITPGGEQGAYVTVDKGLSGGEQVVVQGMEGLRQGAPVTASPVPPPPQGT